MPASGQDPATSGRKAVFFSIYCYVRLHSVALCVVLEQIHRSPNGKRLLTTQSTTRVRQSWPMSWQLQHVFKKIRAGTGT